VGEKKWSLFTQFCCPSDEADEQQIQKKKHVGNDHVSVIWSEHCTEYDPEVIKSQFNFVHVIIYPLQNGLYRIQIKKKDQIPSFGPLVDGALVSPKLLPLLVRATLINANRVVRVATTQGAIVSCWFASVLPLISPCVSGSSGAGSRKAPSRDCGQVSKGSGFSFVDDGNHGSKCDAGMGASNRARRHV
jgi:hypothetical protein